MIRTAEVGLAVGPKASPRVWWETDVYVRIICIIRYYSIQQHVCTLIRLLAYVHVFRSTTCYSCRHILRSRRSDRALRRDLAEKSMTKQRLRIVYRIEVVPRQCHHHSKITQVVRAACLLLYIYISYMQHLIVRHQRFFIVLGRSVLCSRALWLKSVLSTSGFLRTTLRCSAGRNEGSTSACIFHFLLHNNLSSPHQTTSPRT